MYSQSRVSYCKMTLFFLDPTVIFLIVYCTPAKRSNAQHMLEYEKQLLYEENQKSGNAMQQPMEYHVCGINTSSESILIKSYLLVA